MVTLAFAKTYEYDTTKPGVTVPAKLSVGTLAIDLKAKLDRGSTFCIFARSVGEKLGLDIKSGVMERINTVTGSFVTYGHEVRLKVLGFDSTRRCILPPTRIPSATLSADKAFLTEPDWAWLITTANFI